MKPVTVLAAVVFLVVGLAHLARLLTHTEITIGGTAIPMWPSVLGTIVPLALAFLLWRESRRAG